MKYILIFILLFISAEVFSQAIGGFIAPNNIPIMGFDTSGRTVGKGGRVYILKPTNVNAPLSMVNDSTIGLTTPLTVPYGGTGAATFTPYAVITAGTTATGVFQNVSGLGSSGNVLTSAGAGALPTWAAPATSGTVTSIATTSPITGGTITSTGTIACATCVVASSPGVGLAHFAGSTQTVTSSAVSLTADVSGVLPIANGGTNISTYTTGDIIYASATNVLSKLPIGTTRQKLGVVAGVPAWMDSTAVSGSSGWNLTGNASTVFGTNFIGTTDNIDLDVRTNSIRRAQFGAISYIDSIPFGKGGVAQGSSRVTNLGVGDSSLFNQTTGNQNTGLGYWSLARNTTAGSNTAIGYSALKVNKLGTDNTAIGNNALVAFTAANGNGFNTAIGSGAMATATTATSTTAVGYQAAGNGALTGLGNVAVGYQSLLVNTSGTGNVAVGYQALKAVASNSFNTAVGYTALTAATGARHTAIGYGALTGVTSGTGDIGIGESANYQVTTGTDNIRIGREDTKTTGITTGSYNVIIGTNVGLVGASSLANTVILADGQGNMLHYINSSKQHGLNYTSPTATLQIAPNSATTAGTAPLKFTYFNLATTAASGTGSVQTLTFAAQTQAPFTVGSTIVVAGVTPAGYNGTYTVTACTTTTCTMGGATTGSQTVAGTITQGGNLVATPENGAVEIDSVNLYHTAGLGNNSKRAIVAEWGYTAVTATYTALTRDYTINATSGTFTVTLPTAVGIAGRVYIISNSGAGTITVGTTSSQTFANVVATPTTLTMAAVGARTVQSDGANWLLLSSL